MGDGGEGLVYRAVRESDGLDVALKMLTALTIDDYPRIEQRGRLMAEIDHPNVMHQIETFTGTALVDVDSPRDEDFDIIYTVADWIAGVPLVVGIEAAGPVAGLRWVAQIARAVASLHAIRSPDAPGGVIHRDIKPSNVRIFQDRAVLIDFGIARPHDTSDLTQGAGTYQWRAPEVLGGPGSPGPASDVWGVGALAYWVLMNEPPRLEGAGAAHERLLPAARGAGIHDPAGTAGHVAGLLETDPDHRPTDLNRWADELDRLMVDARKQPERTKTSANRRRRRLVLLGVAAAAVLAVGAIVFVSSGGGNTEARGRASQPLSTTASTSVSVPRRLTAAVLRSKSVTIAPTAAGTYVMSGTRTDTRDPSGTKPLTQTDTYDAATPVDGVQHQVVHTQQSGVQDPLDSSEEVAFEADGVYSVRQSLNQDANHYSWDWSPKLPEVQLPLHVGASWTYSSEGTISDTDGVLQSISVSGHITVTGTKDIKVNGTRVRDLRPSRSSIHQVDRD